MKSLNLLASSLTCMIILGGCKSGNSVLDEEKIIGTYVRQWEGVQTHAYSDRVLGKYFIQDTIFVTRKRDGYGITNRRWKNNDYDTLGWRSSENFIKPHTATFDKIDTTLNSPMSMYPPMILDLQKGLLYTSSKRTDPYTKID